MFTLPELGYNYDAVEPYIDTETMRIHHKKHHNSYTVNLNSILDQMGKNDFKDVSSLLKEINNFPDEFQVPIKNNAGGYYNHILYFRTLKPGKKGDLSRRFENDINTVFGNLDNLKSILKNAAMKIFGSGWAWLVLCSGKGLQVISTYNQDSPIISNYNPVLGIDVWEHAYYLKYQNRRSEYIDGFFKALNWEEVSRIYDEKNE